MSTLIETFSSGSFAYLVLAVLAVEAAGLFLLWSKWNLGLPPIQTLSFLGAGAAFAIALLIVANNASPQLLSAALGTAFAFHGFDLWLRWRN